VGGNGGGGGGGAIAGAAGCAAADGAGATTLASFVPHSPQNPLPARVSVPQWGQITSFPSSVASGASTEVGLGSVGVSPKAVASAGRQSTALFGWEPLFRREPTAISAIPAPPSSSITGTALM